MPFAAILVLLLLCSIDEDWATAIRVIAGIIVAIVVLLFVFNG